MPVPPPAIVAEIERATAELERARDEVKRLTEYIGTLRLALTLAGAPLTSTKKHRSVSPVDVNANGTMGAYARRAATRSNRDHAGLKILYEKDVTQSKLARELKESRSRVVSWFATGALNRPIPKHHAIAIRDKYGVPMSAWTRIAD